MNGNIAVERSTGIWSGAERRKNGMFAVRSDAMDVKRVGEMVFRYSLGAIFLWAGMLKFAAYEAKNIEPMLTHSPIWSWMLPNLGLQGVSNLIGVIEIAIGALIVTRAWWPRLSALGSIGAAVAFVITLSFMLTTPGVWEPGYGFGYLSALPGQFPAKDLVLLGVSIWTAAEAWRAAQQREASNAAEVRVQ